MRNPTDMPIVNYFVYYTLSHIGENIEWNYGECNFPDGWTIVGMGINEYRINDIIYKSKEQHLIPASKKDELFNKLVAFFEKQYENGLVTRFSITEEQ
jgi:hypothetical protein